MSILFVPLYLRYLGVEAYGVIGFFTSIQVLINLLDLGLSPTFNREVSALSATDTSNAAGELRNVAKTLSAINLLLSVIIGALLLIAAPILSNYWVTAEGLSQSELVGSLAIMGLATAFQFPASLYLAGLFGLQRQNAASIILICGSAIRVLGSVAILTVFNGDLTDFLSWQAFATFLQTVATYIVFRLSLPKGTDRPIFDRNVVKRVWRFAMGNSAVSVLSLILSQTDKLVLSKITSLTELGFYSLAVMISGTVLVMLAGTVQRIAFPHFSRLVAEENKDALIRVYHQNTQLLALLVFPAAIVISVFSSELLMLWTQDPSIVQNTAPVLSIYALGSAINCVLWLPNSMQLAHGWTRLTLQVGIVLLIVYVPLTIISITYLGIVGGALSWLAFNFTYLVLYVFFMHRRILKDEMSRWYFNDLVPPILTSFAISLGGKLLVSSDQPRLLLFFFLVMISACCVVASALSVTLIRNHLFQLFTGLRFRTRH